MEKQFTFERIVVQEIAGKHAHVSFATLHASRTSQQPAKVAGRRWQGECRSRRRSVRVRRPLAACDCRTTEMRPAARLARLTRCRTEQIGKLGPEASYRVR